MKWMFRLLDSACWHLTVAVSTEASNIHFPRGVVSLHGSKNGPSLLKLQLVLFSGEICISFCFSTCVWIKKCPELIILK